MFPDYPHPKRPVDFVVYNKKEQPASTDVLAIGLARYDSDRGGAQEDDRIGGYRDCADEVLNYAASRNLNTKVVFLNEALGCSWVRLHRSSVCNE